MNKKDRRINLICSLIISVVLVLLATTLIAFFKSIGREKLVFTSGSSSIVYNGSALTNSEWELVEGKLKSGHTLMVETTGIQDGVGMSDNTLQVKILDSSGNDVSKKYKIKYELGTLSVKKIQLIITAGSTGKVFDGTPLTFNTFYVKNYEQIVEGHIIRPTITGSIVGRGVVDNVITKVEVLGNNGEDVSSAYSIKTISGKLYVANTKAEIPKIPSVEGKVAQGEIVGESSSQSETETILPTFNYADETTRLLLYSNSADTIYLKVRNYKDFKGGKWTDAIKYDKLISDKYSASYLTSYAISNKNYTTLSVLSKSNSVFYPYYTKAINGDNSDIMPSGDYTKSYTVEYLKLPTLSELKLPNSYANFEKGYREFVHAIYLNVDEETKRFLNSIIINEKFNKGQENIVYSVANYIKKSATYKTNYNKRLDVESNQAIAFLGTYKEGDSKHFALSATMLYRALGIPARYTEGYKITTQTNKLIEVKEKDAYAWVEVYIDGVGWIQVDVAK